MSARLYSTPELRRMHMQCLQVRVPPARTRSTRCNQPLSRDVHCQADGSERKTYAPRDRVERRPTTRRARQPSSPPSGTPPAPSLDIPIARIGPGRTTKFFSPDSWRTVGADDDLIAALADIGISRPSHIQAAAFRALSSAAPHVALADHAGSGKTLAYLAPLVQALKAEERALGGPCTISRCPRFVIVVPTAELSVQVLRVCRALSQRLKFRSAAMTGGRPLRTQVELLKAGVDIAVGTPGRIRELLAAGALSLERCAAIVCDEVDVLLGEASLFAEQLAPLLKAAPALTRCVLVTATLPANTYEMLEGQFPGLVAALGPGLHRTAPGVTEQIVDCSGGNEITEEAGIQRKCAALFAALQERRAPRSIVFCNKIETCRAVENFLLRTFDKQDRVTAMPYHAAIKAELREANLTKFLAVPDRFSQPSRDLNPSNGEETVVNGNGDENPPRRMVLVCTDRASRGVDSAFVDHVVLFDFPRDPSEYVRRVGRTARGAGGQGLVTILVLGRQVRLAKDVVGRGEKGMPVHALPAAMPASAAARPDDMERFAADLRKAAGGKD